MKPGVKDPELHVAFARTLVRLRKASGYSQERMANELGLSRGHASKLETGRISPLLDTMASLARFLGIKLSDFMLEVEKEERKLKRKAGR